MSAADFLMLVLTALKGLIFVDVLLSWIQREDQFPRSLTSQITEPLYAPIRAILRPDKTGGLDFSPLIILLLLDGMARMLARAL